MPGSHKQLDTYSNEAGDKVCQYVIPHYPCCQHELFGLVITRQLKLEITISLYLIMSHNQCFQVRRVQKKKAVGLLFLCMNDSITKVNILPLYTE